MSCSGSARKFRYHGRMRSACGLVAIAVTAAAVAGAAGQDARQSGPRLVQPGAPGEPTRVVDVAAATDTSRVRHTAADVTFMQGMIAHHAQAVEMTSLVPTHTASPDVTRLAERIAVSQADEMTMMREWLTRRGVAPDDAHASHHAHHGSAGSLMPGMLTDSEMSELRAAKGTRFDELFLAGMIRHHEGALVMVRTLLETPGAGQEPELFAFVSDVEADQGMEIRRMRRMLGERTR